VRELAQLPVRVGSAQAFLGVEERGQLIRIGGRRGIAYDPARIGSMIYEPADINPANDLVPVTAQDAVTYYTDPNQQHPVENVMDVATADITAALGDPEIEFLGIPAGIRAPVPAHDAEVTFFGAAPGSRHVRSTISRSVTGHRDETAQAPRSTAGGVTEYATTTQAWAPRPLIPGRPWSATTTSMSSACTGPAATSGATPASCCRRLSPGLARGT
jgi:hypothetical protein